MDTERNRRNRAGKGQNTEIKKKVQGRGNLRTEKGTLKDLEKNINGK
jgi:hypothetical protein